MQKPDSPAFLPEVVVLAAYALQLGCHGREALSHVGDDTRVAQLALSAGGRPEGLPDTLFNVMAA